MSVAVREMSAVMDTRMIVLMRAAVIGTAFLPLIAFWPAFRRQMRFSRPWLHVYRGTLIAVSTHLGFYTLATIPLATASVLFFMAPVFATMLAMLFQGEKVGIRRWSAIAAGFLGAVIILRPGVQGLHPGMLAALASSALFALALSQSRELSRADGAVAAYVSSVFITVLISAPAAWGVLSLPLGWIGWGVMAILVVGGTVRGFADIEAYRYGEASILAPITYLRLVLVGGAGFVFYGEMPDGPTWAGAAIIVAATIYIAQREAWLKRHR